MSDVVDRATRLGTADLDVGAVLAQTYAHEYLDVVLESMAERGVKTYYSDSIVLPDAYTITMVEARLIVVIPGGGQPECPYVCSGEIERYIARMFPDVAGLNYSSRYMAEPVYTMERGTNVLKGMHPVFSVPNPNADDSRLAFFMEWPEALRRMNRLGMTDVEYTEQVTAFRARLERLKAERPETLGRYLHIVTDLDGDTLGASLRRALDAPHVTVRVPNATNNNARSD